jgi:sodium/potassium-transporting ATPase subunit alpha
MSAGQSGFYVCLMIQQCFNLFVCKARFGLPFGAHMFANVRNFAGVFIGAAFTFFLVYTPGVNIAIQTYRELSPIIWLAGIVGGCFLFFYSVIRSLILRALNPIKYNKDIEGLQMFPTRWSSIRAK